MIWWWLLGKTSKKSWIEEINCIIGPTCYTICMSTSAAKAYYFKTIGRKRRTLELGKKGFCVLTKIFWYSFNFLPRLFFEDLAKVLLHLWTLSSLNFFIKLARIPFFKNWKWCAHYRLKNTNLLNDFSHALRLLPPSLMDKGVESTLKVLYPLEDSTSPLFYI